MPSAHIQQLNQATVGLCLGDIYTKSVTRYSLYIWRLCQTFS